MSKTKMVFCLIALVVSIFAAVSTGYFLWERLGAAGDPRIWGALFGGAMGLIDILAFF